MEADPRPVLELLSCGKSYGGVPALQDVDFALRAGEIHALLGENGAGKSTLGKIIAGALAPGTGTLLVDGTARRFRAPSDALEAGIAMVSQETALVPVLSVAQNLELGRERWFVRPGMAEAQARRLLGLLHFAVDPRIAVEALGAAERQMVEIARAIGRGARIIVFDEPTASLTPVEAGHVFRLLGTLRARGVAIVYITHALEDALRLADRVTVLRDGRRVHAGPAAGLDKATLVRLMIGRDVASLLGTSPRPAPRPEATRGVPVLALRDVRHGRRLRGMSFDIFAGEILGLTGLVGSGRSELARVVCGALPRSGGTIRLRGREIRYRSPARAVRDGIVYVTEDRKADGLFGTMTAEDNIHLGALAAPGARRLSSSPAAARRDAAPWIRLLSIAAAERRLPTRLHSGGNQQKIVIAKALAQNPAVAFFDEPTHGVDVGTVPQIHAAIRDAARRGAAVVVISSNLPEILGLADRILVARAGRIVGEFDAATATAPLVMAAAAH